MIKTNNKFSILLMFFFLVSLTYSQNKTKTIIRQYISLKSYKKQFKNEYLTKKDSLKFMFKDGDTLVLLDNYSKPKGVNVPYEYKDSTFLELYKKIAFRSNVDSLRYKSTMKYWKDDIKIFFSKSVSNKLKNDFVAFTKKISKDIDSLNIYEVKKIEDSNYIIYCFGDYEYKSNMKNNIKSDYYISWNKKKQINNAAIKLDNKLLFNDKLRLYELKRLFFGSLGHFEFNNELVCDSYFSNCYSENKIFSLLDKELLSYHYSYGICKGVSLETFENLHKKAKETQKKYNIILTFFHPFEND